MTNLGDHIVTLYANFLAKYGDPDLAAVATAAVINDLLTTGRRDADEEYPDA